MTKGIKIATIGGGSSYTPELIEGFIKRQDELPVRELWLVDVEAGREKLEIVGNLAKRMVKKAGVNMEIHLTLDREEALKDADFVTTQLRVGLLDARVKDERIPNSYGVVGQETNGPGGMFKGLRTIPVILDICKDMERLCPCGKQFSRIPCGLDQRIPRKFRKRLRQEFQRYYVRCR